MKFSYIPSARTIKKYGHEKDIYLFSGANITDGFSYSVRYSPSGFLRKERILVEVKTSVAASRRQIKEQIRMNLKMDGLVDKTR